MKAGDKLLWARSDPHAGEPFPCEYVSETAHKYQVKIWVKDHWEYRWAAKDRVTPAPVEP